MIYNHTDCICLTFLHGVFSNAPSNSVHGRMQSHIACICWTFLHYVLLNVLSNDLHEKRHSHIGYICLVSGLCQLFASGLSHLHPSNHSDDFRDFSPLCCVLLKWLFQTESKWLSISNNYNCLVFHCKNFHFFIIEWQMSWWEQIHVTNFMPKLAYRKSAIHFLTMAIPLIFPNQPNASPRYVSGFPRLGPTLTGCCLLG